MTVFIAWGNIHQDYPLETIPPSLLGDKLTRAPLGQTRRVLRRLRSRWVAQFLLWQLLEKAQIEPIQLGQITLTDSGRPYFLQPQTVDFNISHSGDWVVVILNVADSGESAVGIDIEFPERPRRFAELLAYFAPPAEQAWFAEQADSQQAFYRCWCLREAVLKSQGVGIAKLSEVQHLPQAGILHSAHCPQGRLQFSAELPFYLAAFAAGNGMEQAQYWAWEGGGLVPYPLKSAVSYFVNF